MDEKNERKYMNHLGLDFDEQLPRPQNFKGRKEKREGNREEKAKR